MPKHIQTNYRNLARMYGVPVIAQKMCKDGHSIKIALHVLAKKV